METILSPSTIAMMMGVIQKVYDLKPYVEPTVVLVPQILTNYVTNLSAQIGFDVDTLVYTLALFLAYPLALLLNFLPNGLPKHIFSFIFGSFLLQFVLGVQWIHQLISSLIVYFLLSVLSPKNGKAVVPIFVVGYCVMGHLHRQFVNYLGWDLDFTGPQMVLTIKLYSLAWNIYDHSLLTAATKTTNKASLKCAQFATPLPSLIEYLGYTFNFSTLLAGPAFEFTIYNNAMNGTCFKDGKKPSVILPTLMPLITSLVCMGLFVIGSQNFPINDTINPQVYPPMFISTRSPYSLVSGCVWWKRYCYQWVALLFCRMKYYFAWKNAEGSNNLCYNGYSGLDEKTGKETFENANNMDIWAFETSPSVKVSSASWNKKTSNWLTRYIYMRTGGSLLATYGMSAFWHGFYPGYYMFFISMPLLTTCERLGRAKLSPRFSTGGKWSPWGIVTILTTSFTVMYFIQPFQILAFEWGVKALKDNYFFGHVLCVLFIGVLSFVKTPEKVVEEEEKKRD